MPDTGTPLSDQARAQVLLSSLYIMLPNLTDCWVLQKGPALSPQGEPGTTLLPADLTQETRAARSQSWEP